MRMQNGRSSHGGFGANAQPRSWFEQNRSAMRQMSFARARNSTKRKLRDEEDSYSASGAHVYADAAKAYVLEGLKRIRVSSPPQHSSEKLAPASPTTMDQVPEMMTDDERDGGDEGALVVSSRQAPSVTKTRAWGYKLPMATFGMQQPQPDEACTAMVVFDPKRILDPRMSTPLAPCPRIELVDSDDERPVSPPSDESEPESSCRFEEINDDEDDAMEID